MGPPEGLCFAGRLPTHSTPPGRCARERGSTYAMRRRQGAMRRPGRRHHETHQSGRTGWLRAAVLGSNDAIVSTSSLMVGVAASAAPRPAVLVAGVAGLVAGAMSMAVGEFLSVSSQRDAEQADIERETAELATEADAELQELATIYAKRGLDKDLAMRVAEALSAYDQLGAHLRDELGIDPGALARPAQAAWISAVSFGTFATIPIFALLAAPPPLRLQALPPVSPPTPPPPRPPAPPPPAPPPPRPP